MKKKILYILSLLIIIGLGYALFYFNQYSIKEDETAIHSALTKWDNRGTDVETEIDILKTVQLDNTRSSIVLYETPDKNIGYAQLIKGWNGKYKIHQSGWGTNTVSYNDVKTNDGVYGVLVGKNPDLKIDHIVAKSNDGDFSFTSQIPKEETFAVYEKLPTDLKETFLPDITFYDVNEQLLEPLGK